MDKTQNIVISQIKEVARKAVPQNGQVLLYGSHARGEAREDSDWDILIILDKPKIEKCDYDNVVYPFTDLGWTIGEAIIPVIYTKEEWKNSSFLPFYKNVERDKIVLL
ncbi:MAG: nucleotidyltransferase domain-containing protein [Bacteroidaceae bacterium]|nr:nucleotidyltransferase domain-containing protein [Bacteroidaceae bacterium]MBR6590538.1 nucleotidyltransferase domain-containing protein [Bacteroidaceae bacterium]